MSKKKWNIWRVKNRWLRAAVAWPAMLLVAVILATCAVVASIVGACRGLWEGPAEFFGDNDWPDLFRTAWAAMTGRDAP